MFNSGINRESTLIDLAVKHDIFAKAGSWYSYNEEKIGQGKESVRTFLLENPDISFKIENQIRDLNGLPLVAPRQAVVAPSTNGKKEKTVTALETEELEAAVGE